MMKKILCVMAMCVALSGCITGWSTMTSSQKWSALLQYYKTFSAGLSVAVETAAVISPSLSGVAASAQSTIAALNAGVTKLDTIVAAQVSDDQVKTVVAEVQSAAVAANAATGVVTEAAGIVAEPIKVN